MINKTLTELVQHARNLAESPQQLVWVLQSCNQLLTALNQLARR
jgi:hypothetical protein